MFDTGDRRQYKPEGFEHITGLAAANSPTVPKGAKYALITCTTQAVRYRDDGTDPTSTIGTFIPTDTPFWYAGNLGKLRFIEAALNATLDISYYS